LSNSDTRLEIELERTKNITQQVISRLTSLEERTPKDLQNATGPIQDKMKSFENQINNQDRHFSTQIEDIRSNLFRQITESNTKLGHLDRQRQDDHQRLIFHSEEITKSKDLLAGLVSKSNELSSRTEKLAKETLQNTVKTQDLTHLFKEHDIAITKLSSHMGSEIDTLSKRVNMMNTDLLEKVQFESKSRTALDMKYDQLLKDVRAYISRQYDDVQSKFEITKSLINENYQRGKADLHTTAEELRGVIGGLDRNIRETDSFIKDQVLRQVAQVADGLKQTKEDVLKKQQETIISVNQQLMRHRQEDLDKQSIKDQEINTFKDNVHQSLRQLQETTKHQEIQLTHKINFVEDLVREEANARVATEQQTSRLLQENRALTIDSITDLDQKTKAAFQDLTQSTEKLIHKYQAEWINKFQNEKRKIEELDTTLSVVRKSTKELLEDLDTRMKAQNLVIEKVDQELRNHHIYVDTTIKDQRTVLESYIKSTEGKVEDLAGILNEFRVSLTQQLEQKSIHFESELQIHNEELEKRIRQGDLDRLDQKWAIKLDEQLNNSEQNRRLLNEEVASKLQLLHEQINRRIHDVDLQQHVVKEGLEMHQQTFQQFHQSLIGTLSKYQYDINSKVSREDLERSNERLENQLRNVQSEMKSLSKQLEATQTRMREEIINGKNNKLNILSRFNDNNRNKTQEDNASPLSDIEHTRKLEELSPKDDERAFRSSGEEIIRRKSVKDLNEPTESSSPQEVLSPKSHKKEKVLSPKIDKHSKEEKGKADKQEVLSPKLEKKEVPSEVLSPKLQKKDVSEALSPTLEKKVAEGTLSPKLEQKESTKAILSPKLNKVQSVKEIVSDIEKKQSTHDLKSPEVKRSRQDLAAEKDGIQVAQQEEKGTEQNAQNQAAQDEANPEPTAQ
jgi:hypothetical protein